MKVTITIEERDRAVKYANAAPHPGSASWKEMQAAFEAAKACKTEENYGNVAELRKTLEDAHHLIEEFLATVGDRAMKHEFLEMRHRIQDAIAAPPRNCDVGTAREQIDRFNDFCRNNAPACPDCPLYQNLNTYEIHGFGRNECMAFWGQMLFASAEGGAK